MKTKEKVSSQYFLNIQDIQILFSLSREKARKVYGLADELDDEKFKEYRIEERKVTQDSVCQVLKTTRAKVRKSLVSNKASS